MANKRRPRKIRPPYRRYGPGPDVLEGGQECVAGLSKSLSSLSIAGVNKSAESLQAVLEVVNSDEVLVEGSEISEVSEISDSDVHSDVASVHSDDCCCCCSSSSSSSSSYLPPEVVDIILSYLPRPVSPEILYVSRAWYVAGMAHVYACPRLNVGNYSKFVETISSSHSVGNMVKILDLRNIIQSGKNSYTSRLLRRCSSSLETFIAPQTSFGYAPLVSLRQCTELKTLDLGLVSETVDLRELFLAIRNAKKLERLEFPRSSVFCKQYDHVWPTNIKYVGLAGGISNAFVTETIFPRTITHLSMNHCPFITSETLRSLCGRLGGHLTNLKVTFPLPALRPNALDSILMLCPNLNVLHVSVDYLSRYVFADLNMPTDSRGHVVAHPLKYLTLDSSGMLGQAGKIQADDISLAILEDKLPKLTHIRISNKLGWNPENEEMCELLEVLETRDGGVWVF
jgi:hypothetical protein